MRYVNARNTAYGEDRRTYKETDSGVSSTQRVFNVSYDNGRVEAYLNGVRLFPDEDYTKTSSGIGTSITLASDLGSNNVLEVVGYQGINSGNALVEDNFVVGTNSTGSGGAYNGSAADYNVSFPVANSAGDTVSVWRNGVKLVPTTDYTVSNVHDTVDLQSQASDADEITVQVVGGVIHNNGLTVNSGNDSYFLPTIRGTDAFVLTRDDSLGAGGTTWKETIQSPAITGIKYSNQTSGTFVENSGQTATDPAGGDLVQLTGSNFDSTLGGSSANIGISIDGTSATSISVNSAGTEVTFAPPAKSAGSYTLTATNGSGLSATITISYDATPSWVTASAPSSSLGNFVDGTISGTNGPQIVASEDGSNLTTGYKRVTSELDNTVITTAIAGLTLGDNGYLTGTLAGTNGGDNNFYAVAHDNEGQQSAIRLFKFVSYDYPGSGGTVIEPASYTGNYRSHTFLSGTANFILYEATTVDILVVAGGGSGGFSSTGWGGGGGGAGGVIVATGKSLPAGTYSVVVGAGGITTAYGNYDGAQGNDSYFGYVDGSLSTATELKAWGGGGGNGGVTQYNGETSVGTQAYGAGVAGGSGGGGEQSGSTSASTQTSHNGGTGYGNVGGAGRNGSTGGGGGSAQVGESPSVNNTRGAGGDGIQNNFRDGTNVYYGGGGGGGVAGGSGNGASGGQGGGGTGGNDQGSSGTAGGVNTGGGGGGRGKYSLGSGTGGAGGSGIVVIRYAI